MNLWMSAILSASLQILLALGPHEACPSIIPAESALVAAETASAMACPSISDGAQWTGVPNSPEASPALDIEVEIPDESEDDQPDDSGLALHRKGRSSQFHHLADDATITCPIPPPRLHAFARVPAEAARPRFLSLCRIQF